MHRSLLLAASLLPTCLWALERRMYLPGAAPRDYRPGDQVDLLVDALHPQIGGNSAQLRSLISYDYYDDRFHHCQPDGGPKMVAGSLGGVIFGERLRSSPFKINMLEEVQCRKLCDRTIPGEDATFINERIKEEYALNWLIDGLPAAELRRQRATGAGFYSVGFQLGSNEEAQPILHNHFQIHIEYHKRPNDINRVVGVIVWPSSSATGDCSGSSPVILSETGSNRVSTTYSVVWKESSTPWATRWDAYLRVFDPRIHWLSLINSAVLACFLCAMVGMILARTVSKDLARYTQHDLDDEPYDDTGFKLLHADVFRAPRSPMFISVTVGSGAQLTAMVSTTILFALFGFLSPASRGALPTVMIVSFSLFAIISGYVSARLYATYGGDKWRRNISLTATVFPWTLFGALFLLNLFLIGTGSSGAIPFTTMLAVLLLWHGISLPLTFVGAFLARRHGPVTLPARTNAIPRQIPPQPAFLRPWPRALLAGILPFGAAFIEVYFILNSLFANRTYIAFGFLSLTFAMVVLTTATVSILMCYFALCAEDHRWAWRSFHTGGGMAFWIAGYGLVYWATRLSLDGFASKVLYLGYLLLISLLSYLVCGTIGFAASAWFVMRIYGAVRVD